MKGGVYRMLTERQRSGQYMGKQWSDGERQHQGKCRTAQRI